MRPSSSIETSENANIWPALPLEGWKDTYATLHMWAQVIGKIALAQSPPVNHSWGIAFHVTPHGLSTLMLPHGSRSFAIEFDFIEHQLLIRTSDGEMRRLALRPRTVADFYDRVMALLGDLSLPVKIWPVAVEVPSPIRLDQDVEHQAYDPEAATRFWRVLAAIAPVFAGARADFVGKCSPVHFFWGSFDLAITRFSGRTAPPREGPAFVREAYSHEVISHGFWPGSGPVLEPAFYAYAVPEPAGFKTAAVQPAAAYYHNELGEFILPYEAVRTMPDPAAALAAFIRTTYEGAATLAGWDRVTLERRLLGV
jgi:Family of unknown function (DUF5996)